MGILKIVVLGAGAMGIDVVLLKLKEIYEKY